MNIANILYPHARRPRSMQLECTLEHAGLDAVPINDAKDELLLNHWTVYFNESIGITPKLLTHCIETDIATGRARPASKYLTNGIIANLN